VKIVMVHGELVQEAKEETARSFGGRRWRFDEEDRKRESILSF
jgi:hypothetical protein